MKQIKYIAMILLTIVWSGTAQAGNMSLIKDLKVTTDTSVNDHVIKVQRRYIRRRRARKAVGTAIALGVGAIILNEALRNRNRRVYYSYGPRRRLNCRQLRRRCHRFDQRWACRRYYRRCDY